ncbi:Clp protease N-terminal domain-containing protein [Streptomyces sp. NPDC051561]|uniref:Clp protease N-terminal domain-containing protein n=1 Tax=Streptomyces sp. NPDC051561 TaxID=3365658 RepID=UPI00378CA3DD
MFERFTTEARSVVVESQVHAARLGSDTITEEHLLIALLAQAGEAGAAGSAATALTALGLTGRREEIEGSLAATRRRGGVSQAEADALAGMGIDVDAIVAKVEETHGEGALGRGGKGRRWLSSGHRPFTPGAKKVLERSLRVALGHGDKYIGGEHLLLALVAAPGAVAEVLTEFGAEYGEVERAVFGTVE